MQQYYETLEINSDVSQRQLKQAYRDLMSVWHPDRFVHNERLRRKAEKKTQELTTAYDALKKNREAFSHGSPNSAREWQRPEHEPHTAQTSDRFRKSNYSDFRSSTFDSCTTTRRQAQRPKQRTGKVLLTLVTLCGFVFGVLRALYDVLTYPARLFCDFVCFVLTQGAKTIVVLILCIYAVSEISTLGYYATQVKVLQSKVAYFYEQLALLP